MSKSFASEVAEVAADVGGVEYPYDFIFDGRKVHFRKPSEGEAILISLATGRHIAPLDRLGAVIDLMLNVIDPRDKSFILDAIYESRIGTKTLFGPNDDDGLIADMMEQWSGRPTEPSSPSSASPPQDGSGSTPSTPT